MLEINRNPTPKQLRQFAGIWFPAFCLLVAFWTWKGGAPQAWPIGIIAVGVVLGLLGLLRPSLIKPVFVGLSVLTFPIGWVISNLILIVVYYLVLTPIGLVLRLLGRDSMTRSLDREAKSYWHAHQPGAGGPARYFRQF